MATIIICTDFSDASRNAIAYTCAFVNGRESANQMELILLHLYEMPVTYTAGEGLALTTIAAGMSHAEDQLDEEWQWITQQYPDLNIKTRLVAGALHKGLEDQIQELEPTLIVMGAGGRYSDLLSWDNELLTLFRDLSEPVLVIPKHKQYNPIQNIGFVCNMGSINEGTPFRLIKGLIKFTQATLHILEVVTPALTKRDLAGPRENWLKEQLDDLNPVYYKVDSKNVIDSVAEYVRNNHIDILLVTPRRYGIWQEMFHRSQSRALIRLDATPVLALREK